MRMGTSSTKVSQRITALILVIFFLGCGSGKSVPGIDRFRTQVLNSHLNVSFVSSTLETQLGLTLPIPGLADSTMSMVPDFATNGTLFQFSIGLSSLLNQAQFHPLGGLPDGRPLPDVIDGTLPRWDGEIGSQKLSLYLSNDAFAFFLPLRFKSKSGGTLPFLVSIVIEDEKGNILGKAYAIPPAKSGGSSGLFILLPYLGRSPNGSFTIITNKPKENVCA